MKYLLTISLEFEADDDPAARSLLRKELSDKLTSFPESLKPEIKMRCIYANKSPRTVEVRR